MNPASTTTTFTTTTGLAPTQPAIIPGGMPAPRPGYSVLPPQVPRAVVVHRPRHDEPPSARLARAREHVQRARGLMVVERTRKEAIQALRNALECTKGCPAHLRAGTVHTVALACTDALALKADAVQCFDILDELCMCNPKEGAALLDMMRHAADAILQRPDPFDIGWRTALVWRMAHPEGLQPRHLEGLRTAAQAPYVGAMIALDQAFQALDSEDDVDGPVLARALADCLSRAQGVQGSRRAEIFEQLGAACLDGIDRRANEVQCLALLDHCCTEVGADKAAEFRADLVRTVTNALADDVDRGELQPQEEPDARALLQRALQPGFVAQATDKSRLLHVLSEAIGIAWTREELGACIARLSTHIRTQLRDDRERVTLMRSIRTVWESYTPGAELPEERATQGARVLRTDGPWCEVEIARPVEWTRAVARDLLRCGATVEVRGEHEPWRPVADADTIAYAGEIRLRFRGPRGLDPASVQPIAGGYEFRTRYDRFSASLIQRLHAQWATVELAFTEGEWLPVGEIDGIHGRPVAVRFLLNENFNEESARQFLAHHAESGMDGAWVFDESIWAPGFEWQAAQQAVNAATSAFAGL